MYLYLDAARRTLASTTFLFLALFLAPAFAQPSSTTASVSVPEPAWRTDQFFVQPLSGVPAGLLSSLHSTNHCKVIRTFDSLRGLQLVQVPEGENLAALIATYRQSGLVDYAEPDFLRFLAAAPNDPYFTNGTLWALNNFGQSGGLPHADIDATNAWEILNSASNIVVAVLDTGIRYTHEDLAANMWVNPNDSTHGTNSFAGTTDPNDDNGHGTLVAGVLGGVGNNGKGVTGVAWRVQMMACKCFSSSGASSDSAIIAGIDYARTNGARIINASFSSPGFSISLSNAIFTARQAGIILVAAPGNGPPAVDVDVTPYYPACYNIDNIVSVAYTTRADALGSLSYYGATNVDLAAPGDQIYSTYSPSDNFYWPLSPSLNLAGTSFAAPYVAGAFALVLARYPAETHQQTIQRVLAATDPLPSLAGKCVTGGRLNLRKALSPPILLTALPPTNSSTFSFRISTGPNRQCVIQATSDLLNWSPISTNTTSATGTLDFTNSSSIYHYYRVLSSL